MHALEIVVDGTLMATSHHEKNARLRGVLDVINIGIKQLGAMSQAWMSMSYWPNQLLRSDSSIPLLQRRVWELEKQLRLYQEKHGVLKEIKKEPYSDDG
jgi:hypothetical protein